MDQRDKKKKEKSLKHVTDFFFVCVCGDLRHHIHVNEDLATCLTSPQWYFGELTSYFWFLMSFSLEATGFPHGKHTLLYSNEFVCVDVLQIFINYSHLLIISITFFLSQFSQPIKLYVWKNCFSWISAQSALQLKNNKIQRKKIK